MSVRVAAVDCGTNTVKLLVADLDPRTGQEQELLRESRMVRLGQGVDASGRLAEESLARVFAAVEEYAGLVRELGAERLRFCATSAARDASNGDAFAAGVRERLGVAPEVLSGPEEARLAYVGATRGLPPVDHPLLVVDIGGGSTEVVLGHGADGVDAAHSLDVGAVRMTERHLHGDPPTGAEVAAAEEAIERALDELPAHGVHLERTRTAVAVSGTGLTVAAGVLGLGSLSREDLHGASVPRSGVEHEVARLLAMTVAERRGLGYMHPGRADVIGAGGLILRAVLRRAGVATVRVSVSDILDGIAWSCAG